MEYDLERFIDAQKRDYPTALQEIKSGCKRSHWMWYIFPQILGLGRSPIAVKYSIVDYNEAAAYMEHPFLRANLLEITEALLGLPDKDADAIFGFPDNLKLQSCMTLFEAASPEHDVFGKVLDAYFAGKRDERTLELIAEP